MPLTTSPPTPSFSIASSPPVSNPWPSSSPTRFPPLWNRPIAPPTTGPHTWLLDSTLSVVGVEAPRDRAVAPTEVGLVVLTEEAEAPICNNTIAALVVALLPTGEDLFLEDLAVLVGSQGLVEDRLIIFVVLFCCFDQAH